MALRLAGSEEPLLMVCGTLTVPGGCGGVIVKMFTGGRKFTGRCNVSG